MLRVISEEITAYRRQIDERKNDSPLSIVLSTVATIEFMITLQPYAAFFTFVFLAIKSLMLIKWR